MKKCFKCKQTKPKSEFAKNSGRKDGLQSLCKSCMSKRYQTDEYRTKNNKRQKKHRKENPEMSLLASLHRTAKRIGLKPERVAAHYFAKIVEQGECCEICDRHVSGLGRRLDLDHNHNTLQLRGLLCTNCNQRVGLCWEDVGILRKTIEYLENYSKGEI